MNETELPKPIQDLRTNIEDMMETARKVKGETFASACLFLLNAATITKISAKLTIATKQGAPDEVLEHLMDGMSGALSALTGQHFRALNLPPEALREVVDFTRNVDDKVTEAEEALNKDD